MTAGVVRGSSLPGRIIRVLSFFTIESNLLCGVVSAQLAARPDRDGPAWRAVRLAALVGITVTGIVYSTVLAAIHEPNGTAETVDVVPVPVPGRHLARVPARRGECRARHRGPRSGRGPLRVRRRPAAPGTPGRLAPACSAPAGLTPGAVAGQLPGMISCGFGPPGSSRPPAARAAAGSPPASRPRPSGRIPCGG